MIAVSVHRESFESIWDRWEQMLPRAVTNTVFVTPWWQKTWWDIFGGDRSPSILSVESGDDLLGVAPLMSDGATVSFLGDPDLSDYFDFVVQPDGVEQFYPALVEHLARSPWERLELSSVPNGSPTLECLPALAEERGWNVNLTEEQTTPLAILPDTWDTFVAGLGRKDRHELRRKIRRLDRETDHCQFPANTDGGLDAAMRTFFSLLRASRRDKEEFLTPDRERFFVEIARESSRRDVFKLFFLEVDGDQVAACICFDYCGSYLLYNSGYDPAFSRLSVGLINKALSIKSAIEEGRTAFNFLKGNERYKYNLGGVDKAVFHLEITRPAK